MRVDLADGDNIELHFDFNIITGKKALASDGESAYEMIRHADAQSSHINGTHTKHIQ